jgi:hypothetical protein
MKDHQKHLCKNISALCPPCSTISENFLHVALKMPRISILKTVLWIKKMSDPDITFNFSSGLFFKQAFSSMSLSFVSSRLFLPFCLFPSVSCMFLPLCLFPSVSDYEQWMECDFIFNTMYILFKLSPSTSQIQVFLFPFLTSLLTLIFYF